MANHYRHTMRYGDVWWEKFDGDSVSICWPDDISNKRCWIHVHLEDIEKILEAFKNED